MYLTFSESFKTIEPIVQKILADPKTFFSKTGNFRDKGVKKILARLIYIHLLVQLPAKTLQMLMSLLFYDVKHKNPDSTFLQAIFGRF